MQMMPYAFFGLSVVVQNSALARADSSSGLPTHEACTRASYMRPSRSF
ncbi:MAG: hypothetical protein V4717_03885 [Bacteroidota bacterium]